MGIEPTSPSLVPSRFGDLHVESAGSGPRDLVIITPIGAAWVARALPAALTGSFTIHVVELPGTARSSSTAADAATVGGVVAACEDVTRALRRDRELYLLGHSMNGALALAAGAGGAAIDGVVSVAPPPALPSSMAASTAYWEAKAEPERRQRAADLIAAHGRAAEEDKRALQEAFDRLRRWYDLDFDPTEIDALASLDSAWVMSVFESGEAIDWPATFAAIQVPVLLVLGEHDFVCPPTEWADDVLPAGATVEVVARSSHTPFLEQPEAFIDVVTRWLEATGS